MRLLLDTNVVIDVIGGKQPYYEHSAKIIAMGLFGDARLFMPAQSAVDAFYVLNKYVRDPHVIQRRLAQLAKVVTEVSLTSADLERAYQLNWLDLEDCLIALAAAKADADYIVTRDLGGFEGGAVPIVSPAQLVQQVLREDGVDYAEIDF